MKQSLKISCQEQGCRGTPAWAQATKVAEKHVVVIHPIRGDRV